MLCLAGWGEVHINGEKHRFGADTTLVVPAGTLHQIFNVGPQPLETLAVLGRTPVPTRTPDGQPLPLPWRS